MPTPRKKQGRRFRRLVVGAGVLTVAALAAAAWHWQRALPLERVAVRGFVRADSAEVVRLAALPDSAALFDLDPALIADRVRRAPWVRAARVRRLPTGTLAIAVEERTPVALVVAADGRLSHYLDREGYALPLRPGDPFDVPLLRGLVPAYHPTQPVGDAALLDLLAALATADEETAALVSELTVGAGGEVLLRTSTDGVHGALAVRLGAGSAEGYAEQLRRLHAFWHQAVLTRPQTRFEVVDLRFDGQIVTRESEDRSQRSEATGPAARPAPLTSDP
ncbi:MAG TPA: FtsQ-type POTRA domain-containing protein [Rubricoccaceae bacterium]|jgi:cell division protein FtsQ|nr:FtsQ-type POTRA domain-containing protein [Rubricoccaceae bacterium]